MNNFALIGAAGYIAPRHLKAIRETGNRLVAALDRSDSVGVLDNWFPQADFFTEFERFDRYADKLRRRDPQRRIEYVSICSPNYLHDAHVRFALRSQADAICEKPLVINPWNLDGLAEIERETGRRVYTIMQLRLHPAIEAARARIAAAPPGHVFDVELSYVTARGRWYRISWKGDESKSGGIATNIGVHFFDLLIHLFGPRRASIVHRSNERMAAGWLELERARVRWFLSVADEDLPQAARERGERMHRSMTVDGELVEFSHGFTDLHTESYREILTGRGFGLRDAKPAIDAVYEMRNAEPVGLRGEYHPLLKRGPA